VLVVNEHELRDVTGLSSVDVALAALADQVPAVVVTLGADGARWLSAEGDGSAPGLPARVLDTTGAGDAFAGTLAAALAAGAGLDQAVRRGTAAGALSVGRAGAAVSMPTRAEIDARLAR
jgi:ribokinase